MATETVDPRYIELDQWPTLIAIEAMLEGQLSAVAALKSCTGAVARAADAAANRIGEEGRLIYSGAGTSGRVAAQDGIELGPTYNWPEHRIKFLLAGGIRALADSVEGAEDDVQAAQEAIIDLGVRKDDVLVAVTASGKTPFTVATLSAAKERGALTIAIANNAATPLLASADHAILIETGTEIVAGSTRMKAGTAQKAVLNLLSTAIMLRRGLVHRGLMVNMRISNDKLALRGERIVATLANTDHERAAKALSAADNDIRLAVLIARGLEPGQAAEKLMCAGGDLGRALN